MAIKKQIVADSGILSQGVATFSNTVLIVGSTTANGVTANTVAVTNGVTANTLTSNTVATITTTTNTVTANAVTVGSSTVNTSSINTPTVNTASVVATTANVGTLNSTGLANVGSANVVGALNVGGNVAVGGNMTVTGTVTIQGGATTINSAQLSVSDNIITLNSDVVGAPTENAGIEVNRGTSANSGIRWNETSKVWEASDGTGVYAGVRRVGTAIALGSETTGNYVASTSGGGNGLTVSGTGAGAVVAISMAAANTSVVGAVQLIDSIVSTNTTTAATPNSVKVAYDAATSANTLAAGKIASVGGTAGRISSTGGLNPALDLVTTGVTPGTWTKLTVDGYGRVTANANATTDDISEGTNQYFTTTRARSSIIQGTGIAYDAPSGTITNNDPGSSQLFFKNIADSVGTVVFAATQNQDTIRFGGGVGITATLNAASQMVSFASTGVTSFNSRSGSVTLTAGDVSAVRGSIVNSFNSRTGAVSLTASDVSGALGYTPANAATAGGTNASALSTGTVPTGRLSGAYSGITSVGTLDSLTTTGNIQTNSGGIYSTPGAETNPAFSFLSDSDTGMYRITTNQLGFATAGALRLSLSTSVLAMTGSITATGTITASSDERLKEDIQDISPGEGMNAVMAFVPVKFTRIEDGSRSSGYIAQEFREVAPEQVIEDENGMLAIDVTGASPYHTAAIQYLQRRYQNLAARVSRLEGRN